MDAIREGKDVYVEKPIAMTLEELNRAYDVVTRTDRIVQNGPHGRSAAGSLAALEYIRSAN